MKKGLTEIRIGCILTGFIIFLALLSLVYTPYDINQMDTSVRMQAPSLAHLFGTDNMGRDVFSRAITGARFTLMVAICTVAGCTLISSVLGLVSGYAGGIADEIIMRVIDAINSFPGILIALIPSFTRIVRTGTLQYKDAIFVKSNRIFGDSELRLALVHVFPNIFPILLSSVIVGLSKAILAEASMSYLGLGIQPPAPSWGRMLYEAQSIIFTAPWCALAPGLMIVITIVGFNCIGEGVRKRWLT